MDLLEDNLLNSEDEDFSPPIEESSKGSKQVFKSCSICKAESGHFYINYGAPSCFSCRAFFRRALQKTKNPVFVCKNDNQCPVTVNDRKCRKCRFDLCRKAGMKPELVLDEEQKKLRFRKLIKKNQSLDPSAPDTISIDNKSGRKRGSNGEPRKRGRKPKAVSESSDCSVKGATVLEDSGLGSPTTCIDVFKEISRSSHSIPQIPQLDSKASEKYMQDIENILGSSGPKLNPVDNSDLDILFHEDLELLESSLNPDECLGLENQHNYWEMDAANLELKQKWHMALERFYFAPEFLENVVAFHKGFLSISKTLFQAHLGSLAKLFADFALQQEQFLKLSVHDQRSLIDRNTPLFIQFILGMYLTAPNALLQLRWLFMNQAGEILSVLQDLEKVCLERLGPSQVLFNNDKDYQLYLDCVKRLDHFTSPFDQIHLIAQAFIYRTDSPFYLNSPFEIETINQKIFNLLVWSHHWNHLMSPCDIESLTMNLRRMAFYFGAGTNISESPEDKRNPNQGMLMPYTEEEEKWLRTQFSKFDSAFLEVSFGNDLLHEFVMYSLGVPLSKGYIPKVMAGWVQRHKYILAKQDEFNALPMQEQATIMKSSVFYAVSMSICKLGSCDTGMEQVAFGVGYTDSCNFEEKFGSIIKQHKLQKVRLGDVNPYIKLLDPEMMSQYSTLIEKLSPLLKDSDTYKLLTLITMFSDEHLKGKNSCSMVNRYLTLLRRRLHHQGHPDEAYERILVGLNDIAKLSVIIKKILYFTSQMASKAKQNT